MKKGINILNFFAYLHGCKFQLSDCFCGLVVIV
jgi:hypothetical protein